MICAGAELLQCDDREILILRVETQHETSPTAEQASEAYTNALAYHTVTAACMQTSASISNSR